MQGDPATPQLRIALAFASAVLAPAVFRVAAMVDRGNGVALVDLRGFASDATVALLVLALAVLASRVSRLVALALVLTWTALQYANYESIRVLGSLISVRDASYLADPTFLRGSALVVSRPALLSLLCLACPLLAWFGLRGAPLRIALWSAAAVLLLLGAQMAWPWNDEAAAWRQTHFVPHDAGLLLEATFRSESTPSRFVHPPAAMLDLVPGLAGNLDGEPRLPVVGGGTPVVGGGTGRRKTNVLLVVLESATGAVVPSLAQDHGRSFPKGRMPELDAIAREHLAYSTFLTHQRKTNRGLYALLCGELPNLLPGLPKMSDAAKSGWQTCLPQILEDAGYATAYLQAAPLAFMLKDQFMPSIGFRQVHGREWFDRAYAQGPWGLDDRAFFEQSLEMIDRLQTNEKPWFLTLLTVGTHHPYVLPKAFRPDLEPEALRALTYLDEAIGDFVKALEDRRVTEDTLILLTSDESMGLRGLDPRSMILFQNWGLLIALVPGGWQEQVSEPFGQVDLALSILDFLDLAEDGTHFFGRSVFRRYDAGRFLFFANSNLAVLGALDPDGDLLLCRNSLRSCQRLGVPDGRLFARSLVTRDWRSRDEILRALAVRSLRPAGKLQDRDSQRRDSQRRDWQLLADPVFLAESREAQVIHGGQSLTLQADEWLEVHLELETRGDARVSLEHILRSTGTDRLYRWEIPLNGGQILRMHYTYAPGERTDGVGARSLARVVSGERMELRFKRAQMTLRSGRDRPEPGVQVQRLNVQRRP